jgi:hypothetical protein
LANPTRAVGGAHGAKVLRQATGRGAERSLRREVKGETLVRLVERLARGQTAKEVLQSADCSEILRAG